MNIIFKNDYMLIGKHIFVIFLNLFVIRNFWGYMLIYRNAEGVQSKRNLGTPDLAEQWYVCVEWGRDGVMFICAHAYDVAFCANTVRNVALGLWLVGHPCCCQYHITFLIVVSGIPFFSAKQCLSLSNTPAINYFGVRWSYDCLSTLYSAIINDVQMASFCVSCHKIDFMLYVNWKAIWFFRSNGTNLDAL